MSDGMLHDILEVERQIEADLARERSRAAAWLEQEKEKIDRLAEEEMVCAATTADRDGETKCRLARSAGAERLLAMRRHVRRLKCLSEKRLRQALLQKLPQVLGGDRHDHPDDKS